MPSREEYLSLFDLATIRALEYGPADRPWIPASTPGIRYIDHLSTEDLRKKHGPGAFYKPEDLCEIHFVNDGRPLAEILGDWVNLDLVAASHVIEHIPDVLRWLQEIASILAPDGRLMLAAPNKRYIFDFLRHVTPIDDVIADYLEHRIKPSPRAIFEHWSHAVHNNNNITWIGEVDPETLVHCHALEESYQHAHDHATPDCAYMDVHVSVFTPYSFVQILSGLTRLGLLPLELQLIEPSNHEFFAILKRCDATDRIEERIAALDLAAEKLPFNIDDYYAADFVWKEPRSSAQGRQISDARIEQLEQAAAELERLRSSASWRLTEPLRSLRRLFR
jgi:SAM-dependent methyltransferase